MFAQFGVPGQVWDGDRLVVKAPPPKKDIAEMIGCRAETVIREMKILMDHGYLSEGENGLVLEKRALDHYRDHLDYIRG